MVGRECPMKYHTLDLRSMISLWDEKQIASLFSSFRCSLDPDTENFLKNSSVRHEKKGISRTYLVIQNDDSDIGYSLKGYFTLAIKCFSTNQDDQIPEWILTQMNVNNKIAQAYLLGQLAKADDAEKGLGRIMLDDIIKIFKGGYETFGCRTVRLDCKDEPKLVEYYETQGFISVGKNHDNALNQMVVIM